MIGIRSIAVALALSASGLVTAPVQAATGVPYAGVGQHQAVMSDIHRAQQRNDAAISHVQNNIRSTRPKTY